jgi:hypothetical protein
VGGFGFAMCSAQIVLIFALAADGVDICETMFDGDAARQLSNQDELHSFAFKFLQGRKPEVYDSQILI